MRRSRPPRVDQFLPSLGFRDAVGTHTLEMHRVFAQAGRRGGVWAEDIHPELARRAKPYRSFDGRRGPGVIVYQASTGSRGLAAFVAERAEPKVIYFHNITPAEMWEPFDPAAANDLRRGREELRSLCTGAHAVAANSRFSADEIAPLVDGPVRVIPPYLPPALDVEPSRSHERWLRGSKRGADILFVGRVVPNKNHAELMKVFATYRSAVDPGARLFLAGAWGPVPYMRHLMRLRDRIGGDGVVFTGSIDERTLAAHYVTADVFCCLSRHEGFGLPVIEAMRFGVPVVAYDHAAIPETLGGSGILVHRHDPGLVAGLIAELVDDEDLRRRVVARQFERVAELTAAPRDEEILALVDQASEAS